MSEKTVLARKDVQVGQLVWATVAIANDIVDKEAMKKDNGGKLSTTAKNIFGGKVTDKLCYVLAVTDTHLVVVYETTFGKDKTALPAYVTDSTKWYPVQSAPAIPGNAHAPLADFGPTNPPSWVYVGQVLQADQDEFVVKPGKVLSPASVKLLKAAAGVP